MYATRHQQTIQQSNILKKCSNKTTTVGIKKSNNSTQYHALVTDRENLIHFLQPLDLEDNQKIKLASCDKGNDDDVVAELEEVVLEKNL